MQPALLKFHDFSVVNLAYKRQDEATQYADIKVDVHFEHNFVEASDRNFKLKFVIKLHSDAPYLSLTVETLGHFSIEGQTTSDIEHTFTKVNAPAILYPYVRAFISNFTLSSGIGAVVLPPLNFMEQAQSV